MDSLLPVDGPPATGWLASRPAALDPSLWAETRPTDQTLVALALPRGQAVHGLDGQLLGWESGQDTDCDLGELWLSCARRFPDTGLWPIVDSRFGLHPGRHWHDLTTDDGRPYWRDPYAVPSDVYDAVNCADRADYHHDFDADDESEPLDQLLQDLGLPVADTTLAEASTFPDDPLARLVAPKVWKSLTLVACRRPADSLLVLDFGVPNDNATPGIFTGVLRSWETRFGVVPVMLDLCYTSFQVLAPPIADRQVDRLATEVFAFAIDTAMQGGFYREFGDRDVGAPEMVRSREWLIWWD
ncbi:MAG: DUF4253 domain-containing protein [Propionibacteriaceae bacterium]|jgi:hypothetical protein|nr:DUF4253 domain-containing protein [Propionibacteriaceae bacterium]